MAFMNPYDSIGVMVDDDRYILIPLAVAGLIDTDVNQSIEP